MKLESSLEPLSSHDPEESPTRTEEVHERVTQYERLTSEEPADDPTIIDELNATLPPDNPESDPSQNDEAELETVDAVLESDDKLPATTLARDLTTTLGEDHRSRYQPEERDESRCVLCCNTPNIQLFIEKGLAVNKSQRKKYPKQTIFLDGVYTGAPFFDNKTRHYSLDHHSGCVRAFTLATCEQAVVMLLQGMPLSEGQWQIYINDPDLDASLAAWILLNHTELKQNPHFLEKVMPLIRVEGVIDAHGTAMAVLTAMPPEVYQEHKNTLDGLMAEERRLKTSGKWYKTDWHGYLCDLLRRVDELIYPPELLDQLLEIKEDMSVSIMDGRIAVLVSSKHGVYQVEEQLKARYGKTLGLFALKIGPQRYTLRQVDSFLKVDLQHLYKALNKVDPAANKNNAWGGSEDIGGSPREAGTELSERELLNVVERVFGPKRPWYRRLLGLIGFGTARK